MRSRGLGWGWGVEVLAGSHPAACPVGSLCPLGTVLQGDKDIFAAATSVLNAMANTAARASAIMATGVMATIDEVVVALAASEPPPQGAGAGRCARASCLCDPTPVPWCGVCGERGGGRRGCTFVTV
jgi:hypothetical protein